MAHQETFPELIRLSGVNFRQDQVDCSCCRWSGLAGELRTARSSGPDGGVRYACPACESIIAMHVGLTDQEVLQEMERIRYDLAAELAAQPLASGKGGKANRATIDFQAVRRQIAISGTVANHRDQGACSAEEPAESNVSAGKETANAGHAEALSRDAPDFEAVRRRMRLAETIAET